MLINKHNYPHFLLAIALIIVLIVFKPWRLLFDTTVYDLPESELTGLNHLLTNDLSDLEETRKMERSIERFMSQWHIVGASMAIMKDGKLMYSKGFGYADKESGAKTEVKHIFRIASLSKLVTAVGVMALYERGTLKLSDKVFGKDGILNDPQYVDFKDKRIGQITVEDLLRHQGGFSLRAGDPLFTSLEVARQMDVQPPIDIDVLLRYSTSRSLRFSPGDGTSYSNLGYVILQKVIEKVGKMPYEDFIKTQILYPAGCYDMHIGSSYLKDRFANEVKYYVPDDVDPVESFDGSGQLVQRCYGGCDLKLLGAAGGWVASPTELLKFLSAIDPNDSAPDILKPETIRIMTQKVRNKLAIGWIHTSEKGDWWRTGSLAGTSAMLKRQHDGYSWVFVTNTSSWAGSRFTSKIETMVRQGLKTVGDWADNRDLFESTQIIDLTEK